MHLSKLELFGFKSFANKTLVNFTKGITGIVGPNGCGKTNIVDAIRWCLGEQKSSTLRSDKMENVIFNGTRSKKPMGMSEVSLTIVNDKGMLPTDFSEVTITRRIFRSGESEYLLNKNICRLKDITNLFLDTGMGTNAYSVIELKMVETILSNKADERRRMFEEAAGVNKYKLRRRLSLNKLDDVKKDLTRVNDIVSEVEKNVRSLERQAKKADRYNSIQTQLKEKEIGLAEREYHVYSKSLEEFNYDSSQLNNEKENIDTEIRDIESKLMQLRNEIGEVENEFRDRSQKLNVLNDEIHNLNRNISVSEERSKSLRINISRFEENIREFYSQDEEIKRNIVDFQNDLNDLERDYNNKENESAEKEIELNNKKEDLQKKRNEFKLINENFNSEQQFLSALENDIKNNHKSINNYNLSIAKLNEQIQNLTSEIAKSVGFLEELENEKKQAELKFRESEEKFTINSELKQSLDDEISELRVKELEQKNIIVSIKDKIELFQSLINNLEGVSSGAKALMESEGWTSNEKHLLADIGSPKEPHRIAIETALGNILNNIIIQSNEDLESALDYLKKNQLGKASFILDSSLTIKKDLLSKVSEFNLKLKRKKIEKAKGFINWAANLIETDKRWENIFESNLMNIAIVEDDKTALRLRIQFNEFDFVTPRGELFTSTGIVEAGSEEQTEDSLFGRRKQLENLKNEYPNLEIKLLQIRDLIDAKEEEASKIDLKILSDQGKILLNEITNIDKQISQLEFEKDKSGKDVEKIQLDIQENLNHLRAIEELTSQLTDELNDRKSSIYKTSESLRNFEDGLENDENDYSNLQNSYNSQNIVLERIKGEIKNKRDLLNKSSETQNSIYSNIDKLKEEIVNSIQEIESTAVRIEDTRVEHDRYNSEKVEATKNLDSIETSLKSRKNESADFQQKLNEVRNKRQEVSDNLHQIDVKRSETKIRFENLVQHIKEEYNRELLFREFEDIDNYDFNLIRAEVSQLREKLKNLGPINLLAYSEYEEEYERLQFLTRQRSDLIESEKDLVRTIKEINENAQSVFLETFENIRTNFHKIFQTLFNPGDEADLILEEDIDPLEAKIEIIAKPKGKRPTSIELLSGGEKTLTATALLFAIYLVKPSPFCIMDEVDAPLDDANVDRFTRLLREFSDNTQFIIVTHNKRTMEATESMYGVTIQDEGVSKLVGVQFNEEIGINN